MSEAGEAGPAFLTTREVALLLRVKERTVYDLAASGEIPHRRVTGRLLFPRAEIDRWVEAGGSDRREARPAVLAGSHDPLLDWAVRESGCGLACLYDGSTDGLDRYARGEAAICGLHIPEDDDWNVGTLAGRGLADCVLVAFARRRQGLILAKGLAGSVHGLAGLAGRRVVLRQPGAGGRVLFERLAAAAGIDPSALVAVRQLARTETDVAAAIAAGEAEAGLGLMAVAAQFRLDFVPLASERFDLLVDRRAWFTPPVQRLMDFARSAAFAERAAGFSGYDLGDFGAVRWLSP